MKDFFISFNRNDKKWAEWIAWVLEEAGYTTIIQSWDFSPGCNFVLEMDRAATECDRTIIVLSKNYLSSIYTNPEWASGFINDPMGHFNKLIPVRIEDIEPTGLLKQIVYIDFYGIKDKEKLKSLLLRGVETGRAKPRFEPELFPSKDLRLMKSNLLMLLVNEDILVTRERLNLPCIYKMSDQYYTNLMLRYDKLIKNTSCIDRLLEYFNEVCDVLQPSIIAPQAIGCSRTYENTLIQMIASKIGGVVEPINYNRHQICMIGTFSYEYIDKISQILDYVQTVISIFGPSSAIIKDIFHDKSIKFQSILTPEDLEYLDEDERWFIISDK